MKVLLVTNKVKTYALGFQNVLESLQELGHEVVWAADFSDFLSDEKPALCSMEQIDINTNPLKPANRKAFAQLCDIISRYQIEVIQCSTPIGGLLGRLAGKKMKVPMVIYAVHGFLFFEGASLFNRTICRWEEEWLARYTDVLITITEEDYRAAQKLKIRSERKPYLIHGAGIGVGATVDIDRAEKRESIGVPEEAFVIISAGELNKNKNTEVIVRTLGEFDDSDVHYVACGVGPEKETLEKLSQRLGVIERCHLMGYRLDILELMACSDVFTMMSFREGMPRAVLEAMDLGLPCVGSDTRGIRDLIDSNGGFVCKPKDASAFAAAFKKLKDRPEVRQRMGEHNRKKASDYSSEVVRAELRNIYSEVLV